MKYKTFFRLIVKGVGLFLLMTGFSELVGSCSTAVLVLLDSNMSVSLSWVIGGVLHTFLQTVLGLYLFFGGQWFVNRAIPANRPYCHECGYDLTGAVRNRCPECDTPFKPEDIRPANAAHAVPFATPTEEATK